MIYNLNGKKIKIPDSDIENSVKHLGITKDEAIQMWLEDEGYLENEEQEELERKAKEARITATIHEARNTTKKEQKRERKRKDDPEKEQIIAELATFLQNSIENVENIQILNIGKLISFQIGENSYKIDLIRTRKEKK